MPQRKKFNCVWEYDNLLEIWLDILDFEKFKKMH